MRMERMTAFAGDFSETPIEIKVQRLGAGAGKVRCFECGGTGVSTFSREMVPNPKCPDCKGTGYVLISV
jgi:DnaJ-class molecular chaperone